METSTTSRTALFMAAYRARASGRVGAICADPWAAGLSGAEGFELATRYDAIFPHMELWTAVRTAFIDARVKAALGAPWNIRQVVLLGAGFDSRAVRLAAPRVRFFEVDHPDTQAEKLRRVHLLEGYKVDAAAYVACNFENQDFVTEAATKGFQANESALFVWEGVTPYLPEVAVRATLRRIADGTSAESVVVFDHLRKKIVTGDVADPRDSASRDFVGDLGEPLRFGSDDILPLLYSEGFRRVRTTSFDEACLNFTGTYDRERKFRFQNLVVASRGAPLLP